MVMPSVWTAAAAAATGFSNDQRAISWLAERLSTDMQLP